MTQDYPWYFAVNDRPAKVVRTEDGGMDVQALDTSSGEFVRDFKLLTTFIRGGQDVDELTESEFNSLVEQHRTRINS